MRDEFVPGFFAEQFLQMVQEMKTLLVRHAGKRIIGILALEVDD